MKKNTYFFIRNGIALYTQFVDVSSWTEFNNQYSKMKDGDFTNYEDFSDAHQYGIDSNEKYQEFRKSEVYSSDESRLSDPKQKKMIYAKYIDFSKSRFKTLSEYNEASMFGAEDVLTIEALQLSCPEWLTRGRHAMRTNLTYATRINNFSNMVIVPYFSNT